jgi:hypothetical protein
MVPVIISYEQYDVLFGGFLMFVDPSINKHKITGA